MATAAAQMSGNPDITGPGRGQYGSSGAHILLAAKLPFRVSWLMLQPSAGAGIASEHAQGIGRGAGGEGGRRCAPFPDLLTRALDEVAVVLHGGRVLGRAQPACVPQPALARGLVARLGHAQRAQALVYLFAGEAGDGDKQLRTGTRAAQG